MEQRLEGVARELTALTGCACAGAPARRVGGGSIHAAYAWDFPGGRLFVKVAPAAQRGGFVAEAAGLRALAATRALRVPAVRAVGATAQAAFLALEWIEARPADARAGRRLGAGLAALHAVHAERFGFDADNLIGRTPQLNGWACDWTEFFRERRLRPQLARAAEQGWGRQLPAAALLAAVAAHLEGHRPAPSLLHGDLWGGNWLCGTDGEPVLFDPAVYYGDREADLAMTRLFGGFGAEFYAAYNAAAPLAPGAAERVALYNLYHVLNHANLFGGAYIAQARAVIGRLL